jgi:hypothetical protein
MVIQIRRQEVVSHRQLLSPVHQRRSTLAGRLNMQPSDAVAERGGCKKTADSSEAFTCSCLTSTAVGFANRARIESIRVNGFAALF